MRRSASETRELLIQTGIELLMERGVVAGVSHIRLKEVVAQAGLTTGAAYRLWDNQDHFHRDLAVAATQWRDEAPMAVTLRAVRPLVEAKAPMVDVIRAAAAAHIVGVSRRPEPVEPDDPRPPPFLTSVALRASTCTDPELRAANLKRHRDQVNPYIDLYQFLMDLYGRRLRPPLTIEHFANTLAALGEGFALQINEGEVHPVLAVEHDDGECHEWTVFGLAVQAIVDRFTEPVEAAGPPVVTPSVNGGDPAGPEPDEPRRPSRRHLGATPGPTVRHPG